MQRELIERGYDQVSPTYDATLASDPIAAWMRQQLWIHYVRAFAPRARVLDFTAGTGTDALFLAARGYEVVAFDMSSQMLAVLRRLAAERGLDIDTRPVAAEHLGEIRGDRFDGALSSFAGLNTIVDLRRLSTDLGQLLKPGGRVVLHALNQFCLWEQILSRLAGGKLPSRRAASTIVGGEGIEHTLYDPFTLYREAFKSEFILREVYALSVIAAPAWVRRARKLAPLILTMDRVLGRLARSAGDFFVMDLERRRGGDGPAS